MTICNMSIEAGARAGMIAPDETTFAYLKGRPHAPTGADWDAAVEYWKTLRTDDGRRSSTRRSSSTPPTLTPFVTWGTNPGQGAAAGAPRARPRATSTTPSERAAAERALEYMGLDGRHAAARRSRSTRSSSARAPTAGSRTCAPPPTVLEGRKVADGVRMLVVPGSVRVTLAGRGGGPGRGLQGGRRRVARGGLLDVPGHEPRPARPR